MTWIDDAIHRFGQNLGIGDLGFSTDGVLCMSFEKRGTLFIEKADEDILVYLVREANLHADGVFLNALASCHYREGLPFSVNPGFKEENQLAFIARIPETEFSLPALETALETLTHLHDTLSGGI